MMRFDTALVIVKGEMVKTRLDVLMYQKGLVESRSLAQRMIMAGEVRVNGEMVIRPATQVSENVEVSLVHSPQFVSRGGEKLEGAMKAFEVDVQNKICADVGASTGGFTDCLLQHGAQKVYAIDVGYGILHWKLRNHPKVISMERTNARFVEKLPEVVSLVTIDASFISLKILLPVIGDWFEEQGEVIALVKPQFEAGRKEVSRGDGVIQDPLIHRQVLENVLTEAQNLKFRVVGLIRSPLKGPKGNVEFLAHLEYPGSPNENLGILIDEVLGSSDPVGNEDVPADE